MGLKFTSKNGTPLRLIGIREYEKSQEDGTKKMLHFCKLVDEATFESNEFLLPNDIDPESLTVQTRYNVELDIDGRWTRISLTPAK